MFTYNTKTYINIFYYEARITLPLIKLLDTVAEFCNLPE